MMNSELETQCAQEIRELARQYCDGAFNKGEYRRRRRDAQPGRADGVGRHGHARAVTGL